MTERLRVDHTKAQSKLPDVCLGAGSCGMCSRGYGGTTSMVGHFDVLTNHKEPEIWVLAKKAKREVATVDRVP